MARTSDVSNFWIYIIQKSNRFNSSDINLMNGVVA